MNNREGSTTEEFRYRRLQLQEELNYTRTLPPRHPSFLIKSPVNGFIVAEVIQENLPRLLEIDAKWLASHLFSKKLLSRPILRKVTDSPDNLISALLESYESIKSDGETFNDFLLILCDDSAHKSLVTALKTEYGEYNNCIAGSEIRLIRLYLLH